MTRAEAEELLELARAAKLVGSEAQEWTARLAPERGRLVEAAGVFAQAGEQQASAELAAGVWRVFLATGDVTGGRQLLATALDVDEPRPSRARALALYADGLLAFRAGEQDDSRARNDAALATARAVEDREAEALALVGLSRVAFREGDYARVRSLAAQARELVRRLDPAAEVAPLHMLAAGTRLAGDHDAAAKLYAESLNLNRRLGDRRMTGVELHNLGHVELHRGDAAAAERCFAERLELASSEDPYEAAMTSLNEAALACAHGDRPRAATLLDEAETTLAAAGIALDPDDAFEVETLRAALR